MLLHKKQSSLGSGPKFNQLAMQSTEDRYEEDSVDFRKIRNIDDNTINCINN